MPEYSTSMDGTILNVFLDPIFLLFVLCTIISYLGGFFRSWIISCVLVLLFTFLFFVVIITVGQIAGLEEQIRFYLTASYSFFSSISFSLRDIVLIIVIAVAFQFALALHVTKIDVEFQKHFFFFPFRQVHQYEMENTLETFAPKPKEEERDSNDKNTHVNQD